MKMGMVMGRKGKCKENGTHFPGDLRGHHHLTWPSTVECQWNVPKSKIPSKVKWNRNGNSKKIEIRN